LNLLCKGARLQFVSPRTTEVAAMPVNRSEDLRLRQAGAYLDDQCEVDKTFYNFCRKYRGLKGETPAMRHGITDHVWTAAKVPGYRSVSP
jgi:hypothetical protein